jgi:hypothetical protein
MAQYRERFGVDVKKRAALVRCRALAVILKELLANSLDAKAATVELTCRLAKGTRRDAAGLRAFEVTCVDDGCGCDEPGILRRVGSSTSDLHPETRGRFGQGLIDVLAIAESAEIRTLKHRLLFNADGCQISSVRKAVAGMQLDGLLRHDGEGFDELSTYFNSLILPGGVRVIVNGHEIPPRRPRRIIPKVKLQTVTYDPRSERIRRHQRETSVEIHDNHGDIPMIFELGIPVDAAPWTLPFDINVLQKTPLDVERNMLPEPYKNGLIAQLIEPLSDEYVRYMNDNDDAPPEIKDNRENAAKLSEEGRKTLIASVTGADPGRIVRRDPFDPDDVSESQELEYRGYAPVNRGALPAGVSELLRDAATVAQVHDQVCKPHFRTDRGFPPATQRQRLCMAAFEEIASALVAKPVRCERVRGGNAAAAYSSGTMRLNTEADFIWEDPLGERTLALIIHECSHEKVSGHGVAFGGECELMGARLARWVADNAQRWNELRESLTTAPTEDVQVAP